MSLILELTTHDDLELSYIYIEKLSANLTR
jgi:hypothetical protein